MNFARMPCLDRSCLGVSVSGGGQWAEVADHGHVLAPGGGAPDRPAPQRQEAQALHQVQVQQLVAQVQ